MSIKNIIKKWLGVGTTYPEQEIPDKALEVLAEVDSNLLKMSTDQGSTPLGPVLHHSIIPFTDTLFKSSQALITEVTAQLIKDVNVDDIVYMPRGITFYVDASGDWIFITRFFVRDDIYAVNSGMVLSMWGELLGKTNNARSKQ